MNKGMRSRYGNWLVVLSLVGSILAVALIPRIDKAFSPLSESPGSITILSVGLALTLYTAAALYFGVTTRLSLPRRFFVFTFLATALTVVAKFTLGPLSLYEANRVTSLSFPIDAPFGGLWLVSLVFFAYFLVFRGLYAFFKRRLDRSLLTPDDAIVQASRSRPVVLVGSVLLVGLFVLVGGSSLLFVPLIAAFPLLDYLSLVFSTGLGLLIALALTGAVAFISVAFDSATKQAIIIRDAALLSSFFWIIAAFLFTYHALWFVYLLTLVALWPLRVVVPK